MGVRSRLVVMVVKAMKVLKVVQGRRGELLGCHLQVGIEEASQTRKGGQEE